MITNRDFNYYTYEIGRYIASNSEDKTFKSYKADNTKLIWNVFVEDTNNHKIVVVNLFEYNWVFLWDGLMYAKRNYKDDFNQFADHVRRWLNHEYWSRTEYETVITTWPTFITKEELDRLKQEPSKNMISINLETAIKLDVYTQIMLNWDRFIDYVWNNKHLITKKKLGLDRI